MVMMRTRWFNIEEVEELKRNLIADIEDSHHGPSDAMQNPLSYSGFYQKKFVSFLMEIKHISIDFLTPSQLVLKKWQSALASDH
ncbi:hypothetical protein Tco_0297888 [Tanacetum coccineum]